jgi:lysophospholipase L1-like esterase
MREIVFALIPTMLLLAGLSLGFLGEPENDPELNASPLWGPGDPFYALDPRRRTNLADPILIWRGRPNYTGRWRYVEGGVVNEYETNAFGFRDDALVTPKPSGMRRLLNVGDSATWGLNLSSRADSYSDQIELLLSRTGARAAHWDVANAGVVGYSSFQGAQLIHHQLRELEPDVVSIYLGNNDSSPGGMKDAERAAASAGPLHRWLRYNRFYLMILKKLLAWRASGVEEDRGQLLEQLSKGDSEAQRDVASYYRLLARVTPDQYETNLRTMVQDVRRAGARPILLAVPPNLVWPPRVRPFASEVLEADGFWSAVKVDFGYLARVQRGEPACIRSPSLAGHPYLCLVAPADLATANLPGVEELERRAGEASASDLERVRNAHNAAVHRLVEGDAIAAEAGLEAALRAAEACACVAPSKRTWMHHNLGVARLLLDRADAAFEAFRDARKTWPFAISPDYEERFQRVVEQEQVDWIDLPKLFADADPRFRGSALLHDWVHPNKVGNEVIARALADELREAR